MAIGSHLDSQVYVWSLARVLDPSKGIWSEPLLPYHSEVYVCKLVHP